MTSRVTSCSLTTSRNLKNLLICCRATSQQHQDIMKLCFKQSSSTKSTEMIMTGLPFWAYWGYTTSAVPPWPTLFFFFLSLSGPPKYVGPRICNSTQCPSSPHCTSVGHRGSASSWNHLSVIWAFGRHILFILQHTQALSFLQNHHPMLISPTTVVCTSYWTVDVMSWRIVICACRENLNFTHKKINNFPFH